MVRFLSADVDAGSLASYMFGTLCLNDKIGHLSVSSEMTCVAFGRRWGAKDSLWSDTRSAVHGNVLPERLCFKNVALLLTLLFKVALHKNNGFLIFSF